MIPDSKAEVNSQKFVIHKWLVFWGLLSFVGLLLTATVYLTRLTTSQPFSLFEALNAQMVRVQVWAAMSVKTPAAPAA